MWRFAGLGLFCRSEGFGVGTRLELQTALEAILGTENVYFQPPPNVQMVYPAIVYHRDFRTNQFADNGPYLGTFRYQVTVIDPDPDSLITEKVAEMPLATYVRFFNTDKLNHDIFDVYF
jgi:hypothetical protein